MVTIPELSQDAAQLQQRIERFYAVRDGILAQVRQVIVGQEEVLDQILDGQAAEDLEFQTRLWGSYFGEVIRRRFGGEWELTQHPGGGASAVPTLVVRGARLYPLMKVYRRLTLGKGEDLAAFYNMVSARLDDPSK